MARLSDHVSETGSVTNLPRSEAISNEDLLIADVDVLAPAALGHVLAKHNAGDVRAKYVLEGANGPTTFEADEIFNQRGIVCIPDIYANAGGVTVSYMEWTQNTQKTCWSEEQVNSSLERHMVDAHRSIVKLQQEFKCSMRTAAFALGVRRVKNATDLRGLG
jgi:glutamate dehydrogenase (NAD(P)+)